MDFDDFMDSAFAFNKGIVYVAIVDYQGQVLGLKIREDINLFASEDDLSAYLSQAPKITKFFDQREPILGSLLAVVARYDNRVTVFCPMDGKIVILGFEPKLNVSYGELAIELIEKELMN